MKIAIVLFALVLTVSASAQNGISRDANLSLFGGYSVLIQNTNNYGISYGIYGDVPFYKGKKWNIGPWAIYDAYNFTDNLSQYKSSTSEYGGGLNGGLYLENFSSKYAACVGGSGGIKNSLEISRTVTKVYSNEGKQTDLFGFLSFNGNVIKRTQYGYFTRVQLLASGQKSLHSSKTMKEINKPIRPDSTWDKGYLSALLKVSIYDFLLSSKSKLFMQPKLGFLYTHYNQGEPENWAFHAELALKFGLQDDWFSIYAQFNKRISAGLTINVLKIRSKAKKSKPEALPQVTQPTTQQTVVPEKVAVSK